MSLLWDVMWPSAAGLGILTLVFTLDEALFRRRERRLGRWWS